jgi:hypothetical protein
VPTKQFKWIDRDTAARDILQLLYHAPGQLSEQAIKLLQAIRSPAIIPELKAIVLDTEVSVKLRRHALKAIGATPGNVDFQEFEALDLFSASWLDFYTYSRPLLKHHPVNLHWIMPRIEQENPASQLWIYKGMFKHIPVLAVERTMKLLAEYPKLFNLETAERLHRYGDEATQAWLNDRHDELLYLCLVDDIGYTIGKGDSLRIVMVLEAWPELKEVVFRNCPTIIEEYRQKQTELKRFRGESVSDEEIIELPIWQTLEQRSIEWIKNNESNPIIHERSSIGNIRLMAAETYFLGILNQKKDRYFVGELLWDLRQSSDQWAGKEYLGAWDHYENFVHFPMRFEAANALRNTVEPRTWEAFVEAFFVRPSARAAISSPRFEIQLLRWIARLTDLLCRVEPECPDEELPLNYRPWFCDLVKQKQESEVTSDS